MNRATTVCSSIVAQVLLVAGVSAQPTDLVVDSAQSSIDLTVTLETLVGSRTDSDSAAMSGSMRIELDSYTSPTTITLIDYQLDAGSLSFFFDYSFLGTVTTTADNMSLAMPSGSTPVSGAVMPDGSFTVASVPVEAAGMIEVTGTGAAGSAVDGTSIDLATLAQDPIVVSGNVDVETGIVTVTIALPLESSVTDPDTGTVVTLAGTATVLATGPVPEPTCAADTNGDGMVTPADFSAWVAAFNAMTPACDQNDDGACTPADFSAWVSNYNAGC